MSNFRRSGNGIAGKVLEHACRIIGGCDNGEITLDDAVDTLPEDCRRIVEHLLFNFYRQRKVVRRELNKFIQRPPSPKVMTLLTAAAVQCRFQSGITPESAVNVAVDTAKALHADKFVNAVLRKFLRNEPPTESRPSDILPDAIYRRWLKRFSREELQTLTKLFTHEADFTYRILPGFEAVEGSSNVSAWGNFKFASAPAAAVLASESLKSGGFYIQDPATSFAVSLAAEDAPKAEKVLDLCAAPGGKTLMLGELCAPDCRVVAADISSRRQQRTKENFVQRGRRYEVITASPDELYGQYDIILADMPCSNTGVFRKRPDALWHFSEKKLQEISSIQHEIVKSALKLLAPGGIIILSTCSIEPEENEELVKFFCSLDERLQCEAQQTILPDSEHDGAFAARIRLRG